MSFFYYFLHFISSLVHFLSFSVFFSLISSILFHLSHVHQLLTFISIFLPIHFLFVRVVSCVHSLFSLLPVFLCSFLFILSIDHIFMHFFINFLLFLGSFLPSFFHITSSLPLFHAFVFLYLRLDVFTPIFLLSIPTFSYLFRFTVSLHNPSLRRTDRRYAYVMRSAGKFIARHHTCSHSFLLPT